MRLFALSDLHADYPVNRDWLKALSRQDYRNDTLLLPGDVTHKTDLLAWVFDEMRVRFAHVFYVPGNHELWVRGDGGGHSLDKFHGIMTLCQNHGITTKGGTVGSGTDAVWVQPLYSWYGDEGEPGSLFLHKDGPDETRKMWSDYYFCRWPESLNPADWFLTLNPEALPHDLPVVTLSHFLPRQETMFPTEKEKPRLPTAPPNEKLRRFNFSRVAGDSRLDQHLRRLGSRLHVYGHQHRNRERLIDGVWYVSHCLGYRRERDAGILGPMDGPRLIWAQGRPTLDQDP